MFRVIILRLRIFASIASSESIDGMVNKVTRSAYEEEIRKRTVNFENNKDEHADCSTYDKISMQKNRNSSLIPNTQQEKSCSACNIL